MNIDKAKSFDSFVFPVTGNTNSTITGKKIFRRWILIYINAIVNMKWLRDSKHNQLSKHGMVNCVHTSCLKTEHRHQKSCMIIYYFSYEIYKNTEAWIYKYTYKYILKCLHIKKYSSSTSCDQYYFSAKQCWVS